MEAEKDTFLHPQIVEVLLHNCGGHKFHNLQRLYVPHIAEVWYSAICGDVLQKNANKSFVHLKSQLAL